MDPNANLAEQASLLGATSSHDKQRRSELRRALSLWLARGGFAPDWSKHPQAAKEFRAWQRKARKFQDLWR